MKYTYIVMWVLTIVFLLYLAKIALKYSLIVALGLALLYAIKYFKRKQR